MNFFKEAIKNDKNYFYESFDSHIIKTRILWMKLRISKHN